MRARRLVTAALASVGLAAGLLASVPAAQTAQATTAPQAGGSLPMPGGAGRHVSAPLSSWTAGGLMQQSGPDTFELPDLAPQPVQSGGTAGSGFAQVGGCTFYASNSQMGGFCSHVGSYGHVRTFREWLHGRSFHSCRYYPVPEGMVISSSHRPGARIMLKTCASHIDKDQPWGGIHVRIRVYAEWVPWKKDISIPGWEEQFWDYQSRRHYYPVPRISIGPTYPAMVGTYTYFWATWVQAQNSQEAAKPNFRVAYNTGARGTVYLHAKVSDVVIDPGVSELPEVHCGAAKVPYDTRADDAIPQSEGGSQPSDCWTMYEHSSAIHEKSQRVFLKATVYWDVTIEDANHHVIKPLGRFHYSAFQGVVVAEVQTLVNW
ncbi:MAG: hypothetical protein ACRDQA_02155 [Nocardioidaceae bacterium]